MRAVAGLHSRTAGMHGWYALQGSNQRIPENTLIHRSRACVPLSTVSVWAAVPLAAHAALSAHTAATAAHAAHAALSAHTAAAATLAALATSRAAAYTASTGSDDCRVGARPRRAHRLLLALIGFFWGCTEAVTASECGSSTVVDTAESRTDAEREGPHVGGERDDRPSRCRRLLPPAS